MRELVIIDKNRIGLLADVSYILGRNHINIESIDFQVVGNEAVIRVGIENYDFALRVLQEAGLSVYDRDESVFVVPNKSSELHNITAKFRDKNRFVKNLSILTADGDNAVVSVELYKNVPN